MKSLQYGVRRVFSITMRRLLESFSSVCESSLKKRENVSKSAVDECLEASMIYKVSPWVEDDMTNKEHRANLYGKYLQFVTLFGLSVWHFLWVWRTVILHGCVLWVGLHWGGWYIQVDSSSFGCW